MNQNLHVSLFNCIFTVWSFFKCSSFSFFGIYSNTLSCSNEIGFQPSSPFYFYCPVFRRVFLQAWRVASLGLKPSSLEGHFCQYIVSTIRCPSVPCRTFCMCKNPVFFLAASCFSCSMWDLVPWPGIESRSPVLGAQRLSHWTTREVPQILY